MAAPYDAASLPQTEVYKYDDWPSDPHGRREMEFRLTYKGRLPAQSQANTRAKEKHNIRKHLHSQLKELWRTHPEMELIESMPASVIIPGAASVIEGLADMYARGDYRFVPLVGPLFDSACALDILFLRRDQPGDLVRHGGDIDNRIKVLFDALKVPQNNSETCGEVPGPDENPFFCLLADDKLITEVKVTTDRLLTPMNDQERLHDVHLIIHVRTSGSLLPLGMFGVWRQAALTELAFFDKKLKGES